MSRCDVFTILKRHKCDAMMVTSDWYLPHLNSWPSVLPLGNEEVEVGGVLACRLVVEVEQVVVEPSFYYPRLALNRTGSYEDPRLCKLS